MILALLLSLAALADEPLPPLDDEPDEPTEASRNKAPEPAQPPSFGNDVSIGYFVGTLTGAWPDKGAHGAALVRYDAFTVDRHQGGPRLGLSLWGSTTLWPLQTADESTPEDLAIGGSGESVDVKYGHYGVMGIIRHDPAAPISANAGLGFGRLELQDYYGGAQVLPVLTLEAGARTRIDDVVYADILLRAHWATSRSPTADNVLHEWWMIQLGVNLGYHLR